jgi:hypothetical protein
MLTYEVEILEPIAEATLHEMESDKLIKIAKLSENGVEKKPLQFGCMKGLVTYIADDFDGPLEDFDDYM